MPRPAPAGLIAAAIAALVGQGAIAQEAPAPVRIGGKPDPVPCVVVDIAGHKTGHLDCASQKLAEAARMAQSQARAAIDTPIVGATSPDVRTGVANQTATRQRMGNTFGTSVHPQRPNRTPAPPRPGGQP